MEELFNKEFYIVDRSNFIFYPRVVRAKGFEMFPDEFEIVTSIIDPVTKENKRYPIEYLEQYKSFEEARKEAERLNNLPKNKKQAEEWNNPDAIYRRKFLEESIKRDCQQFGREY